MKICLGPTSTLRFLCQFVESLCWIPLPQTSPINNKANGFPANPWQEYLFSSQERACYAHLSNRFSRLFQSLFHLFSPMDQHHISILVKAFSLNIHVKTLMTHEASLRRSFMTNRYCEVPNFPGCQGPRVGNFLRHPVHIQLSKDVVTLFTLQVIPDNGSLLTNVQFRQAGSDIAEHVFSSNRCCVFLQEVPNFFSWEPAQETVMSVIWWMMM